MTGRPEGEMPANGEGRARADAEDARAKIRSLLASHTTMTIATMGPGGAPSAAAVFYAADEDFNLYFLTEERTQHGQNLAANPAIAATIQADGQDWRALTGLQIRGLAAPVSAADLPRAAASYARKFAFVAGLLAGSTGPVTAASVLAGPLASARFYVLRPHWLRLVDNTVRFGYKAELYL